MGSAGEHSDHAVVVEDGPPYRSSDNCGRGRHLRGGTGGECNDGTNPSKWRWCTRTSDAMHQRGASGAVCVEEEE